MGECCTAVSQAGAESLIQVFEGTGRFARVGVSVSPCLRVSVYFIE